MENTNNHSSVILIGNPGAGKSTLLNSLLEHYDPGKKYGRFKSGVSIAKGLTKVKESVAVEDFTFVDTPGLSDVSLRKQASESIHDALKSAGHCQIIFVVTLESGRVRPDDAATIKLVLDASADITHYGVIFNKVTPNIIAAIQMNFENNMKRLIIEMQPLTVPENSRPAFSYPLLLPKVEEMEDEEDVHCDIPLLFNFHNNVVPYIDINPENVTKLQDNLFDIVKEQMESEIAALNEDKQKHLVQMEKLQSRIDQEEAKGSWIKEFFTAIEVIADLVRIVRPLGPK